MKSNLSGSTYILLTAKYLTHIYTLLKLSNNRFGHTIRKHSYQEGSYSFHFLKIHDQLVDENAFKMTFYHKLVVAETFFFTEKTKIEAQSTKFKVTPD